MKINQMLACALSFVLGIAMTSLFFHDRNLFVGSVAICLLLALFVAIKQQRSSRFRAFQKMLDTYVSRHESDLSQSGAHYF